MRFLCHGAAPGAGQFHLDRQSQRRFKPSALKREDWEFDAADSIFSLGTQALIAGVGWGVGGSGGGGLDEETELKVEQLGYTLGQHPSVKQISAPANED